MNVEIHWCLNSTERQETDRVGDLDNITKPLLDALTGENGILVDDSQIGSIYTYWLTRNQLASDNKASIFIKFNNDYCIGKKNLVFVQYNAAICTPFEVDFSKYEDMVSALIGIEIRMAQRQGAKDAEEKGYNARAISFSRKLPYAKVSSCTKFVET